MLIKDKFNPIFFFFFEIHSNLAKKYINFYNKEFIQNTIIYGFDGSGKYTFVNSIINSIYKKNIKKNKYNVKIGTKEVRIISSNYHFELLLDKYNNNFNNICEIIEYLTESKEINDICAVKIIVIRNILACKNDLLLFLKNKIETSGNNYRFFLIADRISTINNKYRGIFHYINIPYENKEIITQFFEKKINNFNKKLFNSITKNTLNLNTILTEYELGLVNIKNINFQIILKRLLNELLNDKNLEHKKKHDIINEYSKYSSRLVNCYKEQIHYEALLSNIIYIYHK